MKENQIQKKVPLSVVVITKNEEGRIKECLESVSWADEIIVVDQVISRKMETEGKHRNFAYSLARHEWVLSLDADERVTEALRHEIEDLFKKGPKANGYTIPRRNFIGSHWVKYGGMYPSAQLRLFRKDKFRYDEASEVHCQAYMPDPRGALKNDVLHYTYRDFTDAIGKLDRQTDLEARKWFRERRKVGPVSITRKAIDRFVRAYLMKQGYRDGVRGLFLAVNGAMYQFLSYMKYWEKLQASKSKENASR
jgi:glycosyltransferase involved in cell wall biosynthesis